jgi:plasmid stabilization system protein ParE
VTRTLSFNNQARTEIQEAANYYGLESPNLRAAFLDTVDAALAQLLAHPEAAPVARRTIRRKLLGRFPYSLLYTLRPGEIRILAVMHQSRRPFYWWGRT